MNIPTHAHILHPRTITHRVRNTNMPSYTALLKPVFDAHVLGSSFLLATNMLVLCYSTCGGGKCMAWSLDTALGLCQKCLTWDWKEWIRVLGSTLWSCVAELNNAALQGIVSLTCFLPPLPSILFFIGAFALSRSPRLFSLNCNLRTTSDLSFLYCPAPHDFFLLEN